MTELELAWAAGIFDGEGYVCLKELRPNVFQLEVGVGNTDMRLIGRFKGWFGGHTHIRLAEEQGPLSRKPIAYWRVTSRAAGEFLQIVRPYSVVKAEQIDLALATRVLMSKPGVPNPNVEELRRIRHQLSTIKKRGRS